jgi:hypothetical protein
MVNQFSGDRDVVAFGNESVLAFYDLSGVDAWAWLGFQTIFLVVFLALTWATLVLIKHQRR